MTDTEIIKALECCLDCNCSECPAMDEDGNCHETNYSEVLDLINRQKEEIEELTTRNDKLKNHFTIKFDNDKLKEIVKKAAEKIEIDIKQTKSEAIREFARRLIEEINTINYKEYNNYLDTFNTIERVAEEMECGDND